MTANLEGVIVRAAQRGSRQVIALCPYRAKMLEGILQAAGRGVARATLVGDVPRIERVAAAAGLELSGLECVHEPEDAWAIARGLALCREGRGDVLVSGDAPLDPLLSAVLDREAGLRTGGLLSGVSVCQLDSWDRLLLLSDGLLVVAPDLQRRIGILQNAVAVAHKLGVDLPRVALLAATEAVDLKSQVSVDAAQITVMAARRQIAGAIVDGPLGFDNAISAHAAEVKGIVSDVAGRVDILIAPDLESGNLLLKTLAYLCRGLVVNILVGGLVPVVLSSPDDDALRQLNGIGVGALLA